MEYCIELGSRMTYVAFDACETEELLRIQNSLNQIAPIGGGVLVKPSMRPPANGITYAYYARVGRSINEASCEEIFEPSGHEKRSSVIAKAEKIGARPLLKRKSRKKAKSESNASNNPKSDDVKSWWIGFEARLTTKMLRNQICKLKDEISSKGVAIGLGKLPLLNDEMIELLLRHRPTDTAEFCAKIPGSLRQCTDSAQAHKYLHQVINIFRKFDELDPLDGPATATCSN